MATTKQLIEGALRNIGVLAAGEPAGASELADALETAKQLLESWSNQTLLVPVYTRESFTLAASRTYTIGPDGDFDTVRPTDLVHARIRDSGGLETPVEIASLNTWAEIPLKDTERYVPAYLYYAPEHPLGKIEFSALTTDGDTLKLVSAKPIDALPALTADTTYPPGYDRAIRLGLALELAPEYGKQVGPALSAEYTEALRTLKLANGRHRVPSLKVDSALTTTRAYDITHGPGVR